MDSLRPHQLPIHGSNFPQKHMMKKVILLSLLSLFSTAPSWADQTLAKSKNCMVCHAVDKKLVGPAYKDVASKYANQKDAVAALAEKITKGSRGVWGPVPMPPNVSVNGEEAKKLASWILGQK